MVLFWMSKCQNTIMESKPKHLLLCHLLDIIRSFTAALPAHYRFFSKTPLDLDSTLRSSSAINQNWSSPITLRHPAGPFLLIW